MSSCNVCSADIDSIPAMNEVNCKVSRGMGVRLPEAAMQYMAEDSKITQ